MTSAEKPVATRLHIPAALAEGGTAEIDAGQAHRLRHVLRLGAGAAVAGFNARDGEFLCRVTELGRNGGTLAIEGRLRPPASEADLWLLFAPIKRLRLDWLIEKGAELGVGAFIPVMTARTQPERLNRERLAAHAIAAAEQSERLSIPEIREHGTARPPARRLAAGPPLDRLRRERRRHADRRGARRPFPRHAHRNPDRAGGWLYRQGA